MKALTQFCLIDFLQSFTLSQRERDWTKYVNQTPPLPLGEGKLIEVNYRNTWVRAV
jgi:hypothetical protein